MYRNELACKNHTGGCGLHRVSTGLWLGLALAWWVMSLRGSARGARFSHVQFVDAEDWPEIVGVPSGWRMRRRALKAEAAFAAACSDAGLLLDDDGSRPADLVVEHDALFARIAARGWLGLAEGFMAGEFVAPDLVFVLKRLIAGGYRPLGRREGRGFAVGPAVVDIPRELAVLSSPRGVEVPQLHGGMFASGVSTTSRVDVAGVAVDRTVMGAPVGVCREDLVDAQARTLEFLLDAGRVGRGSRVVHMPATHAGVAAYAVDRGFSVDALCASDESADDVANYRLSLSPASRRRVSVEDISGPYPGPSVWQPGWRGGFDAAVSVDVFDKLGADRAKYVASIDAMVARGGRAVLSTLVSRAAAVHGASRGAVHPALSVIAQYLWPGFQPPTIEQIHEVVSEHSSLSVVAEAHYGAHVELSVRLQREFFEGCLREAAAAGYDAVFRRLWFFYLCVLEACLSVGELDAAVVTLARRSRQS